MLQWWSPGACSQCCILWDDGCCSKPESMQGAPQKETEWNFLIIFFFVVFNSLSIYPPRSEDWILQYFCCCFDLIEHQEKMLPQVAPNLKSQVTLWLWNSLSRGCLVLTLPVTSSMIRWDTSPFGTQLGSWVIKKQSWILELHLNPWHKRVLLSFFLGIWWVLWTNGGSIRPGLICFLHK